MEDEFKGGNIIMKTKEELNALKNEIETMNLKLAELTEDELKEVVGGWNWGDNWGDEGYFGGNQADADREQLKRPLRNGLK